MNFVYLLLVLAVTPLVTVISYFGGMLTYPLKPESTSAGAAISGRPQPVSPEARPTNITS
jgi:hypothetical protein